MLRTMVILFALAGATWGHYRGENQIRVVDMENAGFGTPAWSPDGRQLAFTAGPIGAEQVFILDMGTRAIVQLTHLDSRCEHPTWSPDASRIAFGAAGTAQLMSIQADGTGLQELMPALSGIHDYQPAWSPTGPEIAFARRQSNDYWPLAVLNTETGEVRKVGVGSADPYLSLNQPAWSPDGKRLFACDDSYGVRETYLYELDPSSDAPPTILIGDDSGYLLDPSLIENGRSVLYQSKRSSVSRLFVQNLDQKVPREVGPVTMNRLHPALSPDGSTLAFTVCCTEDQGIWLAEFSEVPTSVQTSTWATVKRGR